MENLTISQRTWRRALVMLIVAMRYEIEFRYRYSSLLIDDRELSVKLINYCKQDSSLYHELTHNEKILLECEIGEWPTSFYTQYVWHVEGVGCLLWTLNEFKEFPPHDHSHFLEDVDKYFGDQITFKWMSELLKKNFLFRNGIEIQKELKRSEMIYQRCLISWKTRNGQRKLTTKKYSEIFPFEEYNLPVGPSGDLIVFDKEFCDISETEEGYICPLSLIRVQSFRWVMNPDEGWDDMSLDYLDKFPE